MEHKELELYKDKFIVFECLNDIVEMYQVKTFYYQRISGVRAFRYSMSQNKSFLYYDNKSENSLTEAANIGISLNDIYRLLEQVKLIIEDCHNYLLYPDNFCLHPSFIQVNREEKELKVELLYLPFKEKANDKYKKYMIQFISMISKLFNELNDMEGFYYFVRLIETLKEESEEFDICKNIELFIGHGNKKKSMLL